WGCTAEINWSRRIAARRLWVSPYIPILSIIVVVQCWQCERRECSACPIVYNMRLRETWVVIVFQKVMDIFVHWNVVSKRHMHHLARSFHIHCLQRRWY